VIHEKKAIERGKAYEKELFTGGRIDTWRKKHNDEKNNFTDNMFVINSCAGVWCGGCRTTDGDGN
jgi:hypothetical protein